MSLSPWSAHPVPASAVSPLPPCPPGQRAPRLPPGSVRPRCQPVSAAAGAMAAAVTAWPAEPGPCPAAQREGPAGCGRFPREAGPGTCG